MAELSTISERLSQFSSRFLGNSALIEQQESRIAMTPLQEPLSLAPIGMPKDGTTKMLYNIAFQEDNETHPLREIAIQLFNDKGETPLVRLENEDTEKLDLSGVIAITERDSLLSKPIRREFLKQQIMHDVFTAPKIEPTPQRFDIYTPDVTHLAAD